MVGLSVTRQAKRMIRGGEDSFQESPVESPGNVGQYTVPYGIEMAVARQPVGLFPICFQVLTSCGMDLQELSKTEFWKFDPGSSYLPGGSHLLDVFSISLLIIICV